MDELVTWGTMSTYGGALWMTMMVTQFTKDIKICRRIPTQIWSYVVAVIVLTSALFFTGGLSMESFFESLFNGMIISLAANGAFHGVQRTKYVKSNEIET